MPRDMKIEPVPRKTLWLVKIALWFFRRAGFNSVAWNIRIKHRGNIEVSFGDGTDGKTFMRRFIINGQQVVPDKVAVEQFLKSTEDDHG